MSDWHEQPDQTASFEAVALTSPSEARSSGRHRAPQPPPAEFTPRARRVVYVAALVGLALVVAVVVWVIHVSHRVTVESLTPLGRVTPGPLTTVPFPPPEVTSETSTDTPEPLALGTYTSPPSLVPLRLVTPSRRVVTRIVPTPKVTAPLVVTTTSPPPAETTVAPELAEPEVTPDAPEPEVQRPHRHRWRHWDRPETRVRDSAPSGLLGIIGN